MYSKKFLAFTGIRSDFDLMSYVYQNLAKNPDVEFKILAYGAHLSKKFGYSIQEIRKENVPILAEINNLVDSDTADARVLSMANLMQQALPEILKYGPDALIFAGDREDALVASMIAGYLRIPALHFFGGDHATDGNIDNAARHATSKLSTFHFVSCEEHKQRLLKMGEPEFRIFCAGSPSLDKLVSEKQITKTDLLEQLPNAPKSWPVKSAVLTYHPMYGEETLAGVHIHTALQELLAQGYFIFCNSPNIDAGNSRIFEVIEQLKGHPQIYFFKNLSRTHFVNLMRHVDLIAGNSSAGIIEAATLKKPVVNIGHRQLGRLAGENVVFCTNEASEIQKALLQIQTPQFQDLLKDLVNPYGDGQSSARITEKILTTDFQSLLEKKEDPL